MPRKLERTTFKTSRLAEFCSQKELVNQTGHDVELWPLVLVKELVDNGIDACEEAGIAPVINVAVSKDEIIIADNGPGLPPETVEDILDYSSRVSSREAYASPTRGAQGNALKTVLAMAFALDGDNGETTVEARGVAHRVTFSIDRIRREPKIKHVREVSSVKIGTRITIRWPDSACSVLDDAEARFLQIADDFTWLNPHLTLSVDWDRPAEDDDGEPVPCTRWSIPASNPVWTKWRPSDPTSPHWYDQARLERLIAAYIAHEQERGLVSRTVREFVSEFRGLSGSAKQKAVLDAVGASRMSLADFFGDGDHVNADAATVVKLLAAMQQHSAPVKPRDLGLIGEDHLRTTFEAEGVASETFAYKKAEIEHLGVPYLVEFAFGYCPDGEDVRRIITGINWSVAVGGNPFRNLGFAGESLDTILTEQRAGRNEPIVTVLHLSCPRVAYLDRGKSSVVMPGRPAEAIANLVRSGTKKWAEQRKAEERRASSEANRNDRLIFFKTPETIKRVAYDVMSRAYRDASSGGTLPANARQIYYAARPEILERTGKTNLDSQYFCQDLLVNYVKETGIDWDIVWDDRGHFTEPHTETNFGLGTINVRKYLGEIGALSLHEPGFRSGGVDTHGPDGRFGAVLFIEKEGFMSLFQRVRLAERHDIAIMSTKGMSVTAARILVDKMCGRYKIPVFVLHDFDVSGFSIFGTLRGNTDRYTFSNAIKVVDLGLRLDDVNALGLASEQVSFGNTSLDKISRRLGRNGATAAETEFLLNGERVELNAMTSRQLVDFVEHKLAERGVAKVVPGHERLAAAYRLFRRSQRLSKVVKAALEAPAVDDVAVPDDLAEQVQACLDNRSDLTWDDAVAEIAESGR